MYIEMALSTRNLRKRSSIYHVTQFPLPRFWRVFPKFRLGFTIPWRSHSISVLNPQNRNEDQDVMRHLLRRAPISNRKWLFRAVSVATAGSALAFLPTDSCHYFDYSEFCGGTRVSLDRSIDSKHGCQCMGRDTITNAAAIVGSAVVNLSATRRVLGFIEIKNKGSGTIIDPDGTILTAAHVVVNFKGIKASPKGKVEVTLQDGRTFEGKVLHADLHSDIAIVKIKAELPLPAAKFGSSSKLRPGDWVVSLGSPFSLRNTVTAGIISCIDRKSSDLRLDETEREYLQTDCSLNPGNSGGPLVNMDGEIVGVNVMKIFSAEGLSFAEPIDSVSKVAEHFKKNRRPWLGLRGVDLNETILALLKERDPKFSDVDKGVIVPMLVPGSPADGAGFKPGDIVIRFDGTPVGSVKEIMEIMGDKVGVQMKVVVKRANGVVVNLVVTPEEASLDM